MTEEVWVCFNGGMVYMSQQQAIRATEKMNIRYHVSPELAEANRQAAIRGRYVRADLAPGPLGMGECVWTAAAKKIRESILKSALR